VTPELLHSGKVRDVYAVDAEEGGDLILVASDRISIYDAVLPTPIPDKGRILTRLSMWWFERLADIVPHHVVTTDLTGTGAPEDWTGRAMVVRRLEMVPVECIARGYLAGLGLKEYEKGGEISGQPLPPGLVEGSRLPEPVFTPTTKAPVGVHDEFMTFAEVAEEVGELAQELRELTLKVYRRGAAIASEQNIIVADTKLEFGFGRASGLATLTLGDEVLTPDSSRFWPADQWEPGRAQHSFDKQLVRDWSQTIGWDKVSAPPEVPEDVVELTRSRYIEVYERITGERW
jgi:phosphoribosylaminoimidazole-succinocarboxamide synthase